MQPVAGRPSFIGVMPFLGIALGVFLAGLADGYSSIFRMTMWNESLPDAYRGRVASFGMLSDTSGPLLGNTIIGFLGDAIGLKPARAAGGLASLIALASVLIFLPMYWKYRSPE